MISERTEQTANTQQDELLVRQAQSGDNEAEARLLDKYKPLVKAKSRAYFSHWRGYRGHHTGGHDRTV